MSPRQNTVISFAKRLLLFVIIGTASLVLIKAIYALGPGQSPESSSQQRQFKTTEFKDMPLEVTSVANLQSEKWNEDLQIEVKNVSRKPIYFILAYIIFPEAKGPDGEVGIRLMFGKNENLRIRQIADEKDPHLDPDETYVFTIPEPFKRGFEARTYKDFRLDFFVISFGDGTGFDGSKPRDFRGDKNLILERPTGQEKKKSVNSSLASRHNRPTVKSQDNKIYQAHASAIQGECGGGNGCSPWDIQGPFNTSCYCNVTLIGVPQPACLVLA